MLSQLGQPALGSGAAIEPGTDTAEGTDTPGASPTWHLVRQWGLLRSGDPLPEPVPVMQRLELDSPL
jgi:hypothetical protein